MVELRLGKINNEERKFIPAKKEFFEEYINGLKEIEKYELTQTFKDGYKYRCYNDNGDLKFTRNKKMGKITDVIEIDKDTFYNVLNENGKCVRKIRKYYNDGPFEIDVDYFSEPLEMILVEVATIGNEPLENYNPPYGFIEVTGNSNFENANIYNGSIISNNTIIEGTDGVGKTTTIEGLLKLGIICQDRCMDVISVNMLFDIPMEVRAKKYQEYLKNIDKKVIFLVNNDREEIERRINIRERLSEFDKLAYEYNVLYLDTYNYMKERNMLEGKLFLVDCTGLSIEEVLNETKKIIINN